MAKIATYNCPHRLDKSGKKRRADLIRLHHRGVTIVGVQENIDSDPQKIRPTGWEYYRPPVAASAAVLWNNRVWRKVNQGYYKLSSDGDPVAPRYIVWVALRNRKNGRYLRFGSLHLPAFKTSRAKNRKEFIYQEKRAAAWLSGGPNRILVGDFNASPGRWTPTLNEVGMYAKPLYRTGPTGQRIDLVYKPKNSKQPKALGTMRGSSDHRALIANA